MGRQLQRDSGLEPQVTMTLPILVGLDGVEKMSKSKGNYIGVTEPAGEMFGKSMSIPDALMPNYFELLTSIPREEYERLIAASPRDAKVALGSAIVAAFHGEAAGREAAEEFDRIFSRRELPSEMPDIEVEASALEDGRIWIVALITSAGFASSNGEARRLIAQGAVSLDDERISDASAQVGLSGGEVLKVGKRRFGRVTVK